MSHLPKYEMMVYLIQLLLFLLENWSERSMRGWRYKFQCGWLLCGGDLSTMNWTNGIIMRGWSYQFHCGWLWCGGDNYYLCPSIRNSVKEKKKILSFACCVQIPTEVPGLNLTDISHQRCMGSRSISSFYWRWSKLYFHLIFPVLSWCSQVEMRNDKKFSTYIQNLCRNYW